VGSPPSTIDGHMCSVPSPPSLSIVDVESNDAQEDQSVQRLRAQARGNRDISSGSRYAQSHKHSQRCAMSVMASTALTEEREVRCP
jgi:hypothetical protein